VVFLGQVSLIFFYEMGRSYFVFLLKYFYTILSSCNSVFHGQILLIFDMSWVECILFSFLKYFYIMLDSGNSVSVARDRSSLKNNLVGVWTDIFGVAFKILLIKQRQS